MKYPHFNSLNTTFVNDEEKQILGEKEKKKTSKSALNENKMVTRKFYWICCKFFLNLV